MSSGDLVPAPQGNFAQTGTVDWVQFGDTVVTQSYKTLARLVNHGVDSYTIRIGLHMAQLLPLAPVGEKRMREATRDLGFYGTLNKDLLLGMGPESIPHMLEKSVEGLALLAISAALSDIYVEEVAAEVLHELLLHLKPPHELTPSLPSWSKVVKGCAGSLSKTKFGIMAEKFMSFHPSETSLFPTRKAEQHDENHDKWRSRSHAKDIAKALITLGEVSRGKLQSVTIIGGGDSGFLAAVAEWLFDMNIVIVGNEEELYRNSAPGSTVQARFEFRDRMDESPFQSTDVEAFQYPSKTVHLRDVSDILFMNDSNEVMKVSGRLEWSCCLFSAFGYAFQSLMDRKQTFSLVLGCAGRIFRAIATAEQGISLRSRNHWIYYTDAGSGSGFVQNLMFWFPELKSIELITQKAAACELANARANYESGLCNLATTCRCLYCDCTETEQPRTGYCLVALAETILKAALILSNVSIDPGLHPTRLGFDRLYEGHIEAKPRDKDALERREAELGPIVWVIEPGQEDQSLHSIDHRMRLMMDGAIGLFTFLREVEDSITCALASGGICAYWKILEDLSIYDDHGFALGRIHIVPGRIEWNGIAFGRVQDWYDSSSDEFSEMQDQNFDLEMEFTEHALKMEQSFDGLRVGYCLTNSKQHFLNIPPTWLLNTAIGAHGWSRCQKTQGCSREGRVSGRKLRLETTRHRGKEVALYQAPNDRTLCAALAIAELLSNNYCVIINDNCRACTLDLAVAGFETQCRFFIVSFLASAQVLKLMDVKVSHK
jgi:hypothetical protein